VNILITGAKGRMGQSVIRAVEAEPATRIGAAIDVGDSLADALGACDAVIDFTTHGFTTELVEACVSRSKSLIMGTTGHNQDELEVIAAAAKEIPIVHAPNFSVGVNTLFWLARHATRILGANFDLEVVEMHHRHKTDAPSGTARRLAEILAEASGVCYDAEARHGRVGDVGARTAREIGVHAVRGGDVVGDHTAIYAGAGERLELTHKASSRDTFAEGAVRAAVWLAGKPAGLYDMEDVLGLREAE
jgi:4-hydroxy-tetrahydrodipicolinate reductase